MASEQKDITSDREVTISDAHEIISMLIDIKQPGMLWGQPGIGKSDLIAQIAREKGRNCIDIRLNLMDPTDMRGIPYKTSDDEMKWAPAACFPRDPNDTSIILLDELTIAAPSVQAAALQLVLNRRIGDYVLPDGVAILAAGNRETDKTAASKMPSALANRFVHLNLCFNFKQWQEWAFVNGVNHNIIAFLSAFTKYANTFDAKTNTKIFATPRSWVFASRILDSTLPLPLKIDAIAGTVGEAPALAFNSFYKNAMKLPKVEDILSGKVTKLDEKEISVQYAIIFSLLHAVKQASATINKELSLEEWCKIANNFLKFSMNNFEPELCTMAFQLSSRPPFDFGRLVSANNQKIPAYNEFFTKFAKFFKNVL